MNRRSIKAVSVGFFVLSAAMLGCAIFSACAHYVAYAALLFFCGWLPRAMLKKASAPTPAATERPVPTESDEDFLKWATEEPEQRD